MSVIGLIVILVLIGVALFAVNRLIPMDAKIKTIINVVVVLLVVLWLVDLFFGFGTLGTVPRFRTR